MMLWFRIRVMLSWACFYVSLFAINACEWFAPTRPCPKVWVPTEVD